MLLRVLTGPWASSRSFRPVRLPSRPSDRIARIAWLERRDGAVERTQEGRKAAIHRALVGVGIPPIKGDCADAGSIGSRHEFRSAASRFGEIGAHLRGSRWPGLTWCHIHATGAR